MSEDSSSFDTIETRPLEAPSNRAITSISISKSEGQPMSVLDIRPTDRLSSASIDDIVIETDILFTIENDDEYIDALKQLFEVFVSRLSELKGKPSVLMNDNIPIDSEEFMEQMRRDGIHVEDPEKHRAPSSKFADIDFINGYLNSIIDVSSFNCKLLSPSVQAELIRGFDLLISRFGEYKSTIEEIKNTISKTAELIKMMNETFDRLSNLAVRCAFIISYSNDDFAASFTYVESTHKWLYQISAMQRDEMCVKIMDELIKEFEEVKLEPLPDEKSIKTSAQVHEYASIFKLHHAVDFITPLISEMKLKIYMNQNGPSPDGALVISRHGDEFQILEVNDVKHDPKHMRTGRY